MVASVCFVNKAFWACSSIPGVYVVLFRLMETVLLEIGIIRHILFIFVMAGNWELRLGAVKGARTVNVDWDSVEKAGRL